MSEDEIKAEMGSNYHICSQCSMYKDAALREQCRLSKPITVGDLEAAVERIISFLIMREV